MVQRFARTARERIRIEGDGYRRDHLRALAQRVEVADREVRIIGSKTDLLQTLAAAAGARPSTPGVRSSVLKWRREWDSPQAASRSLKYHGKQRVTQPALVKTLVISYGLP